MNGAHDAGQALADLYLKFLRDTSAAAAHLPDHHMAHAKTDLTRLVESIVDYKVGSPRGLMLFGFLSGLDPILRFASKACRDLDDKSFEALASRVRDLIAVQESRR